MNSNDTRILVKDFNFYYGDFKALKDINMEIKKNKVTALIGPSGCGKSTFLRSINRMNDLIPNVKYEGNIIFDGKNIFDKEYDIVELRKKIGMVFQKPNPFPKSIYENLVYAPKLHGEKDKDKLDEIVETSLKSVALWDEVKDKLHKSSLGLSGGQQQRLCIARAISIRPEILLMDEPTSALDPISTSKIEELIRQLEKEYSIIIVTHNMQQASRISEYTGFFYQGVLEEFDKTELIFTTPHKKKTEDYITGKFG
ncbi:MULTISPECIES: phosphate ABC transporter ATP-binding protein PstB [Fusobacterium]|jgi:phosphate transport system ATP-binding protein|uniref:Phosphate ABC transporter ATP-binding protein n=2 Tax=Fusobacterium mortiferum TaxID=850 RepID=A0A414PXX3_FUSMR|nr:MULTISPECIES: phosphate ABC transporter ATP-binding protein PstB [Fusobacterium]AVQ17842.1 phosphate ABC transporter ATP-binding protein [Fusobacterium mortiferum ATCC 9817]EEO36463.1 phosphate ABC transporter, ATP-binding protein [Fusobacterium mortiferum ATCC 9817]MCF2626963.1 phosphate ABC transporter ATP-binding protein [Fusobacterium mortiferum]MCF2698817.1 phosphate ABC transporter ATP-binding protein [Fusobacterium mortiferum]MCI6382560.1 phosphate ABC transporter ATP-binding protein